MSVYEMGMLRGKYMSPFFKYGPRWRSTGPYGYWKLWIPNPCFKFSLQTVDQKLQVVLFKGAGSTNASTIDDFFSSGTAEKSKTVDLQEEKLWREEEFLLFMSVYEMGMLRKELVGKDQSLVLSMGCAEGALDHMATSTTDDVYFSFNITNAIPCIHLKVTLPDLRKRLYLSNRIYHIQRALKVKLLQVEKKIFSKNVERAERILDEAVEDFVDSMKKFDTSCKHLKLDDRFMMKKIKKTFVGKLEDF